MITINQPSNGKALEPRKRFRQESTLLEPGIAKRVGLGAYNKAEPEPEFALSFEPETAQEHVKTAFDTMDIPGGGRTLYFCVLLNSGDKRCRVTIALREGEKK